MLPVAAAERAAPTHVRPLPHRAAAPERLVRPAPFPAPSLPVRLDVPEIGVSTPLIQLGLTPTGALEVPAPGAQYDLAGWYRGSPRPGAIGPAVIAGHIDSAQDGPSVFYRLRSLRPGDIATVTASDGTRFRFVVDQVEQYAKDRFPTAQVYGDAVGPELRLITCGGDFDRRTGHYLDNTVVSAHLIR
jgi:sortase (surface protein transpeptidase)